MPTSSPETPTTPATRGLTRFSAADKTFVIEPRGDRWALADERGESGGLFATLHAALRFARHETAHLRSHRVIVLG